MAPHTDQIGSLETDTRSARPEPVADVRYMARQPIHDLKGRVHAYELLFRNPPESVFRRDADMAMETMLDNEVLFGLERLSNGLPVFIGCTAEALTDNLVLVLTPSLTVLTIPANLEPTPNLVEACRSLKARGFRVALDDFAWRDDLRPLLEWVDYVRVDFRRFGTLEKQHLQQSEYRSIVSVAQKVETQEDFRKARDLGFTLFAGEYFCHPTILTKQKIPANRIYHFEIVRELYKDPLDVRKVSQLVRSDAALMYRLLRLANSPVYGFYQEIRSIETAIRLVGEDAFRRVVSVAVLSELNAEQPAEILHMGLLRARFCELAARAFNQDPSEQYLLGMFSVLPAMLGVPMEEIVASLPFRTDICRALRGAKNEERTALSWIEFHERGDWESCDKIVQSHGGGPNQLVRYYEEALIWAAAASPGPA